jgi:CubicO group peptidase (beta-lactamase class C family)
VGYLKVVVVLCMFMVAQPVAAQVAPSDLEGLWVIERTYAPALRGTMEVRRSGSRWSAVIGDARAQGRLENGMVRFGFGAHGDYRATIESDGALNGMWLQPNSDAEERDDPTATSQAFASPLQLERVRRNVWRGEIHPLDGRFTLYLRVFRDDQGRLAGAFRNYEINSRGGAAQFLLSEEGDALSFVARFDNGQEVRHSATRLRDPDRIRIFWPDVGSDLELARTSAEAARIYTPRPPGEAPYIYRTPDSQDDGWRTAPARDSGLDEAALASVVQSIIDGDPSARRPNLVHSVLVAHRGRLVLEEYFNGFTREAPHDIRSGGKTFASILLGAVMESGAAVSPETPVYQLLSGMGPFDNPDPRKARMTLAHMLTHTSGLDCDDNNEASLGNEGMLWQQTNPNFWKYTLDLPMRHEPGERYAYCSANLNLMGAALTTASGQSMPELFDRVIAEPLQFGRYYWNVMPNGQGYLGGGAFIRPRDWLKVGQTFLDGGVWNGRRIVSEAWVERSTSPRIEINPTTTGLGEEAFSNAYVLGVDGYAWHRYQLTVGDRTVQDYEATGNGGQLLIIVPEYDLVVVFTGGNYMQGGVWNRWRQDFVAARIIPAITN